MDSSSDIVSSKAAKTKSRRVMTLQDYFPRHYLEQVSVNTVSFAVIEENRSEDDLTKESSSNSTKGAKVDAILDALPARMGWQKLFHLPEEMRQQLSLAILQPEAYADKLKAAQEPGEQSKKCVVCNAALAFTDEDLLLGSKLHNRPLFVSAYIRERKVGRILVDGGSAVNIMPKATMEELGISVSELAKSRLMIQGFNLGGQKAIGMISVEISMGDMLSTTLFQVIDAKTSYKLLLGRPWLHENGVVASTLHQCLKYYRDGEKNVNGDVKPFSTVESYFADTRFYEENDTPIEMLPSTIFSTGTKVPKKTDDSKIPTEKDSTTVKHHESVFIKTSQTNVNSAEKKVAPITQKETPILKYVPKSTRKDGETPFTECAPRNEASTSTRTIDDDDLKTLKNNVIVPVARTNLFTTSKQPLPGFTMASMEEDQTGDAESTKGRFDPNAYKLMSKFGYDFKNPTPLGNVIEVTPYGLTQTQKKLHQQGNKLDIGNVGIGFSPLELVKISARRKAKQASSQYIVADLAESENENTEKLSQMSVFDRLGQPTSTPHSSVFDRLGEREEAVRIQLTSCSQQQRPNASVFTRIGRSGVKKSVFSCIGSSKVQKRRRQKQKKSSKTKVAIDLSKDIHSVIPSKMKRHHEVEITMDKSLKVKSRTVIFTNPQEETSQRKIARDFLSSNHVTAQECPDLEDEIEVGEIPKTLEDGVQVTVDDLTEINLGTNEEPRPVYISSLLTDQEQTEYVELLSEYKDVFAWSYQEMPGLSPKITVHRLAIRKGVSPKKQPRRRFRPEMLPEIEAEVNKLIDAGFIREVKYPTWIANIVPDDFPLPVTEIMIDATTGHEALSFMDCTAGYNQIQIAPEDEEATGFRTTKGIFCYKVMPFGLKNAGATYQRAMQKIFDDMLHDIVECYVDDLVVKSKKRVDHVKDLRTVFERLRKCKLKMNPLKCAFGVNSDKFLGFIVHHRGIEIDQSKIKAIKDMAEPSTLKDLRSLQGRLAYIRRFISNLAGRCHPFSHLMKKGAPFEWDELCRKAFDDIKKYLSNPPVLGAPIPGKSIILYISAQEHSMGALCAQENEDGKERALYYLSRTLVGAELGYSSIEKMCLALIFAIQKLRHYFQAHTVHVISKADPIKYILSRPVLLGRLAKWAVLLKQYDIVYIPQKAVKGQALADFLVDHPVPGKWSFSDELPGEGVFYIDVLPSWQMSYTKECQQDGDALANLAATLALGASIPSSVPICKRWVVFPEEEDDDLIEDVNAISVYVINKEDWRQLIIDYLEHKKLPNDPRHKTEVRRRSASFIYYKGILYRRSFNGLWLRCLDEDEGLHTMEETHAGICGAHQSGPKLCDRIK
ncbi:uncharacterized protein LOC141588475 [Silene latifolia]|uniref:uncharacterized protein LOC141588475 n=1 Tax=Silene latifolia TaxID=37657 RepID=UPI003D77CEAD